MITLEQLNENVEILNLDFQALSSELNNYITRNTFDGKISQMYSKLSVDIKNDINKTFDNVLSKYENDIISEETVYNIISKNSYTKSEIDSKGFLTTHQSLNGYAKKSDLEKYTRLDDIHTYIKCNCMKKEDFDNKLKDYVLIKNLNSELSKFYTKEEIDDKYKSIEEKIKKINISSFITESKFESYLLNLKSEIGKTYLSKSDASLTYWTISRHQDYDKHVDETYLKKSDLNKFGIDTDFVDNVVLKSDLDDYVKKAEFNVVKNTANNANGYALSAHQKVSYLENKLSNDYLTKYEIFSNYYLKTDLDKNFLKKTDATKNFLSVRTASEKYLTKEEARLTYLAIEDYRYLKGLLALGDIYNKNDIDNFHFATENYVINYVNNNCKGHNWVYKSEY